MTLSTSTKLGFTLAGVLALLVPSAQADTFGSGGNAFTIDFVNIGNAGNADDRPFDNTFPDYSSPYGGVAYTYRMGVTEVPQDWITRATASGLTHVTAGAWTGSQPAANMNWYEAAAFVNWLNTSTGHQAAYDLTWTGSAWAMTTWNSAQAWQAGGENLYRHKDAIYFLTTEDEWYKAAYHRNDGVTANYWDYATGSDNIPTQELTGGTTPGSAVYNGSEAGFPAAPANVGLTGGLSPYGTRGQNGNIWEWLESAMDGQNDIPFENRAIRGGIWTDSENSLRSVSTGNGGTDFQGNTLGFRVASVPEPSCAVLMIGSAAMLLLRRRRVAIR